MRRNWHKYTSEHNFDSTVQLSDPENLIVMKLSLYGKGYAEELARNIIWDALHATLYNRFWTLASLLCGNITFIYLFCCSNYLVIFRRKVFGVLPDTDAN